MQLKTRAATIGGAVIVALGLIIIAKPAITAVFSSPMRDVDNVARMPVHLQVNPADLLSGSPSVNDCFYSLGTPTCYQVPSGYRLIIDSFSGAVMMPSGQRALVTIWTSTSQGSAQAFLPLQWAPSAGMSQTNTDTGCGTTPVELVGEQGAKVFYEFDRLNGGINTGQGFLSISVEGHLVGLP